MNSYCPSLPQAIFIGVLCGLGCLVPMLADAAAFPEVSSLPAQTNLPNSLLMFDGTPVKNSGAWSNQRRPELKALFQHYMYGHMPPAPAKCEFTLGRVDPKALGGKATLKEVTIRFGPKNLPVIHLLLVVPNHRTQRAPVFFGLNFNGNHTVLPDPAIALPTGWMPRGAGVTNNHATEAGRGTELNVWAIEQSIDRGYAVGTIYNGDIEPDRPDAEEGVRAKYLDPQGRRYDWGNIAAWAWGLHRVVDYLVTDKDIDPRRMAVFGHSRNGKAAIVAGAFDDRIALVIPHQAGCGGTAPSRGKIGESVQRINTSFPHWFNAEFKKFNEQPEKLPFDQHCLIALIAPRPVLLSNATEDQWANPSGQFEMLRAAEPVYRLLKAGGLDVQTMPETGKLIDSKLGYYIRPGKHSTTPEDWKIFLDFAEKYFGNAK